MIFHYLSGILAERTSHQGPHKVTHFLMYNHSHDCWPVRSCGWRQKNKKQKQTHSIVPLNDESFSFEELLPQFLHDHLFAGLLMDAGLAAILVAADVGSGTSCGNNLHFEL